MSYDMKRDLLNVEMEEFGIVVPEKYIVNVTTEMDGEVEEYTVGEDADWSSNWADFDLITMEVSLGDRTFVVVYESGIGVVNTYLRKSNA